MGVTVEACPGERELAAYNKQLGVLDPTGTSTGNPGFRCVGPG